MDNLPESDIYKVISKNPEITFADLLSLEQAKKTKDILENAKMDIKLEITKESK